MFVIGKIPAYNSNISNIELQKGEQGIKYENRLLNNLTDITFKPTGYEIKMTDLEKVTDGVSGFVTGVVNFADNIIEAVKGKKESTIHAASDIVKTMYSTGGGKIGVTGLTANLMWENIAKHNMLPQEKVIKLICTNDSTVSEILSNNFDSNYINTLANDVFSKGLIGKTQNIMNISRHLSSQVGLEYMNAIQNAQKGGKVDNTTSLFALGKVLNFQSALPRTWVKSDYTNTMQVLIKLVSPTGDPQDINNYINTPLRTLFAMSSPITLDGINFGFPPIWEITASGLNGMKLGAIESMTITRGGTDTQFNRFNQPLNVDIRMTIAPLALGFATSANSSISMTSAAGQKNYNNMLVNTPSTINTSLLNNNGNKLLSIKL
jgi:hypothetical protein